MLFDDFSLGIERDCLETKDGERCMGQQLVEVGRRRAGRITTAQQIRDGQHVHASAATMEEEAVVHTQGLKRSSGNQRRGQLGAPVDLRADACKDFLVRVREVRADEAVVRVGIEADKVFGLVGQFGQFVEVEAMVLDLVGGQTRAGHEERRQLDMRILQAVVGFHHSNKLVRRGSEFDEGCSDFNDMVCARVGAGGPQRQDKRVFRTAGGRVGRFGDKSIKVFHGEIPCALSAQDMGHDISRMLVLGERIGGRMERTTALQREKRLTSKSSQCWLET